MAEERHDEAVEALLDDLEALAHLVHAAAVAVEDVLAFAQRLA